MHMAMATEKRSPVLPLLECLESPPESTILILLAPAADKRKRLYKAFEKNGIIVECPQLDDRALENWIRKNLSDLNITIDSQAIATLIGRIGSRLSDMKNALNLLVSYVSGRNKITETDVLAACVLQNPRSGRSQTPLPNQIRAHPRGIARAGSMNIVPDEIIGTINWLLETAYRAHAETKLTVTQEYVPKRVAPLAKKFTLKRLQEALALCTRTQFALRSTGTNPNLLLEVLVIKLSEAHSPRSKAH